MSVFLTSAYKLKEHSFWNDGSDEAKYQAKPQTLEDLTQNLKIIVKELNPEILEFDVIGVGPPIINAIRRILIAEVPTMAIDKVQIFNNTSVIPDEVLAHRLGLIPIKVDPKLFTEKAPDEEEGTEDDSIQFELKVKCTRKNNAPKDVILFDESTCNHSKVLSGDLKFVPIKNQKDTYGDIRPVHDDILIAVMRPGHEIDLKAFCYKSNGRDHAKFSPIVVASYRLLPELRFKEEISGEKAHELANCFPKGVIKVSKKKDGEIAKIVDPRKITCSRNVMNHEDLKNSVEILKTKEHYIFTVETAGALLPERLVKEAIGILKEKCRYFLNELKSLKV